MFYKPNFPRMKKFQGEYYELQKVHKDREKLERRGSDLKRRGYVMRGTVDDFEIVRKNDYYALYVR